MNKRKKRKNGTGSAIFLGNGRYYPWVARINIGKDINGTTIYFDIDSFETELEALVCLENYHKQPHSLYVKEDKYNRIFTFPKKPYPLVPVRNPKNDIVEKTKKNNYTFKQLYEKFKEVKMLTKEEMQIEKKYHTRPKDKPFGRNYCRAFISAFNNSVGLHDKVYKDLRASDFTEYIKKCNKGFGTQRQMINLYTNLDKFALSEDIIEKGYSQYITIVSNNKKEIMKSKDTTIKKEKLFSYEQIDYLWNLTLKSEGLQKQRKQSREMFVRDFWLMLLYSGTRADELLSVYTANVFLDDNYFIGGLKTEAGINREIPIHPAVKHLYEKYYNPNNEFLFTQPNGNKVDYAYYYWHFEHNFEKLHPEVSEHDAHDARHTLRTELRKIGIKEIIINSIIGHSNDNIGDDIYTHVSIKEKQEALKLINYKETNKLYLFASNQ